MFEHETIYKYCFNVFYVKSEIREEKTEKVIKMRKQ